MGIKNDRRTIFGWAMYDWANSAYATTTVAVLFPALLVDEIVPPEGVRLFGIVMHGEQLGSLLIGFGALVVFLLSPVLGAIADFSASKKRFLQVFAYTGATFATLMFFVDSGGVSLAVVLFLVSQWGFVGSIVFYDAYLPDISTTATIDKVSSKGFAMGYLGGGLNFLLVLILLLLHDSFGLTEVQAARIGLAFAGLWWLAFAAVSFRIIPEVGVRQELPERYANRWKPAAYTAVGFKRTIETTKRLRKARELLKYVLAFILYNDGVQTVIAIAPFYAKETLNLSTQTLALGILLVQAVAVGGALLFGRIAGRIGTKGAILISIGLWSGILSWAYFVPAGQEVPFYALAGAIGLVLGGTQALSRSLYGSMIPEAAAAEFFGFFSVFEKFSAIIGPFIFFFVSTATGSSRNAILSLIAFFVIGGIILSRVDVDKARASRLEWET